MKKSIADWPIYGLILKEFRLTLRNKHLLFLLIFPPIVQVVILAYCLDPQVRNMRVAIVDMANTVESRSLAQVIANNHDIFWARFLPPDPRLLTREIIDQRADAGIVIPADFSETLERSHQGEFQVILNGVDAFTANVARGYFQLISAHAMAGQQIGIVQSIVHIAFNPGLISAWYFVPGVLGAALTLSGTLVSSAAMLRERESGTLEQLLVLPVSSAEILVAKTVPLFLLLFADLCVAILITTFLFALPLRGSIPLYLACSGVYILTSIAIGSLMATVCSSQRQSQLLSFFINIPAILLSGSVVPLESMPPALQMLSRIDPLRYYQMISRDVILKGLGPQELSHEIMCLVGFCLLLGFVCVIRIRRQLS